MLLVLLLFFVSGVKCEHHKITDVVQAQQFLDNYEKMAMDIYYKQASAGFTFYTNLTQHNSEVVQEITAIADAFKNEVANNASKFDWQNFKDEKIKRLFRKISDPGMSILDDDRLKEYTRIRFELEDIYSTAKVCDKPGDAPDTCYPFFPDLDNVMYTSRDWDTLLWAWKGWRDATGPFMKDKYTKFIEMQNEAARMLGYSDAGAYWRVDYDDEYFEDNIARIWNQLKPLYQQLHAYIRRKLRVIYGREFPSSGHIPAHLLGNIWAQQWGALLDIAVPYPNEPSPDVTAALLKKNYTVMQMFRTAEDFFMSLGMEPLPQEFWNNSMFVNPNDGREVDCYAAAFDMSNTKDFRIKMCTVVNGVDFATIHHEMGHIYYFMLYKDQPFPFREGANPGFHEAVGDTITLSASTPKHLKEIGIFDELIENEANDLNYMMSMALDWISFLPFGYLVDQWRWSVFRGDTEPSEYNQKWWDLRCNIQGVSPPDPRSYDGFDPGSKYHIPGNVPYIRYFVSFILQYQFHKALCETAGHIGPLHKCDIYNSKEAGQKMMDMLSLGASEPWQDALEKLTGTREMDASALVEYFDPIIKWLENENKDEMVGWSDGCPWGSFEETPEAPNTSGAKTISVNIFYIALILPYLLFQYA